MNYTTVEAKIDHGHITVQEPDKLPAQGRALLIVFPADAAGVTDQPRHRVRLPLIQGDGKTLINPTPEELDDSLWD